MYKPRTRQLQGMVEGTVFIVAMKETIARGIWKSPKQKEEAVMARRLD